MQSSHAHLVLYIPKLISKFEDWILKHLLSHYTLGKYTFSHLIFQQKKCFKKALRNETVTTEWLLKIIPSKKILKKQKIINEVNSRFYILLLYHLDFYILWLVVTGWWCHNAGIFVRGNPKMWRKGENDEIIIKR